MAPIERVCIWYTTVCIEQSEDFTYNAFHMGVKCTVTSLTKNRIYKLNTWSRIEEAVHYLQNKEESQQEKVLQEQIKCMEPKRVGEKVYAPEVMMRAFEYFATSRSLYGKLRKDFKLPSEKNFVIPNIESRQTVRLKLFEKHHEEFKTETTETE